MNKFRLTCTTLLLTLASSWAAADTRWLDSIAAIVDDDIILVSELQSRLDSVNANIARSGQQAPPAEQLQREVLDLLIIESIQMQMADRVGLRIDDEQLNGAVGRIAAKNNMSLEQFRQALISSGTSYLDFREQIRREMILQRVQMGNVNQRIQISEQELNNYLSSEDGLKQTSPEYHFAHILVPVASEATQAERDAALKHAQTLAQRLRRGENYNSLASSKVQVSDLGWRKGTDLPSLFADVAPTMGNGDVSEPLQSASGYHVIELLESKGVKELVSQTRASHILLKPSAIRNEKATEKLAADLRTRAMNGESFADMAREYSEDIGSAQEGGDLGWTMPGQLVPEFQEGMENTAIGQISQPIKSQYGWHIIKVVDRRQHDVTDDLRKRMARNALHDRKYQDELDIWLRKIRSEAYVDIKI
ncbi:peptidylprolyl isomerase [Spongiibacter sp. KMU-158]|uniref:Chaperone SurA n=1 Tax=Spongiibacter pelagi TaxID=2760804 RepID=A0A927C2K5_9GAMM|nr:peptidylprolyl isomerase [Spongiibacter pelagi]MBD2858621.1 peptidylprolyl isomerase [Spongiibacter pelagi]